MADRLLARLAVGLGAGLFNGAFARARGLPVSGLAVGLTAAVVGISEGALVAGRKFSPSVAIVAGFGTVAAMAPFATAEREVAQDRDERAVAGFRRARIEQ